MKSELGRDPAVSSRDISLIDGGLCGIGLDQYTTSSAHCAKQKAQKYAHTCPVLSGYLYEWQYTQAAVSLRGTNYSLMHFSATTYMSEPGDVVLNGLNTKYSITVIDRRHTHTHTATVPIFLNLI